MAKIHTQYICQQCGYKSPSFLGKCPNCESWNTFVETLEKEEKAAWSKTNKRERSKTEIVKLSEVTTSRIERIATGLSELDQVLGSSGTLAGLVPGSVVLFAGDPGIGKSTLTLQVISHIGGLYVSGEESAEQIKLRAERLGVDFEKIFVFPETNIEAVIEKARGLKDRIRLVIIDSIQTIWSEDLTGAPGSIGQVRECTLKLLEFAKSKHVSVIIIGHVTKEGTIAGPKVLEHIVDTVLSIEGERYQSLRLVRATKNRFGPVDEVGVFSMEEKGLKEVKNPSELFLGEDSSAKSTAGQAGSVAIAVLEGTRPILVEVQALTVSSNLPMPRRVGNGINNNRLQMIVAVIQKHLRIPLGNFDIFVNVASGIKVFEPAADLGICLSIISSFKNKPLSSKTVAIGEVGLLGEVRNVIGLDKRIKEAKKLGFDTMISSKTYRHIGKIVNDLCF